MFRVIHRNGHRRKWYRVFAKFELEDRQEIARFRHPGDAYRYAQQLWNKRETYAIRLELVEVEA